MKDNGQNSYEREVIRRRAEGCSIAENTERQMLFAMSYRAILKLSLMRDSTFIPPSSRLAETVQQENGDVWRILRDRKDGSLQCQQKTGWT